MFFETELPTLTTIVIPSLVMFADTLCEKLYGERTSKGIHDFFAEQIEAYALTTKPRTPIVVRANCDGELTQFVYR